jgi:hypothetical protein
LKGVSFELSAKLTMCHPFLYHTGLPLQVYNFSACPSNRGKLKV